MSLLLRCPRIVDGIGGTLTQHGVLLEGERIARIAPISEFEGYQGEEIVLDGSTTLLPGLIDCHVHLCFDAEPNPGEVTEKMRLGAVCRSRARQRPAQPRRRHYGDSGLWRQGLFRVRRQGRLQSRPVSRADDPRLRAHDLYDRRAWQPIRAGRGRYRGRG